MSCFYNATKMLWSVGHPAVRYWIYSTFSCVFHSGLMFMWICLCFVKLVMRCLLVTLCVVIGGCAVPWSTSQTDVFEHRYGGSNVTLDWCNIFYETTEVTESSILARVMQNNLCGKENFLFTLLKRQNNEDIAIKWQYW